jgi:restriction endonuclease Mrr
MPIPTYDTLMLPVLRHCAEKVWIMRDLVTRIADDLGLSQEERVLRIPSGTATIIQNRVGCVKTYLKQAGLLMQPKRGVVEITQRGREVLSKNPEKIDVAFLNHVGTLDPAQSGSGPDDAHALCFRRRNLFTPGQLQKPFTNALMRHEPACRVIRLGLGI